MLRIKECNDRIVDKNERSTIFEEDDRKTIVCEIS